MIPISEFSIQIVQKRKDFLVVISPINSSLLTISVGCSEVPLPGDKIAIGGYIECIAGRNSFLVAWKKHPALQLYQNL